MAKLDLGEARIPDLANISPLLRTVFVLRRGAGGEAKKGKIMEISHTFTANRLLTKIIPIMSPLPVSSEPIPCQVRLLGRLSYDAAWRLQDELAAQIARGEQPPTLLLLEHPHVFTLGRRAADEHLLWDEAACAQKRVEVRRVDRGGDITYHGPGQLVGYPLLPLAAPGWQSGPLPKADFVGYLRRLEEMLISALTASGLQACRQPGLTGVWVSPDEIARCQGVPPAAAAQPAKIASIGVKIDANGVTRHGFALNVDPDMSYWQGIVPCGLEGVRMISLAELLEPAPPMETVISCVIESFGKTFNFSCFPSNS